MRLRVATLNVWGLPEPIGYEVGPRIRALGKLLPSLGLDVMALQEVWTAEARERLTESGRRAGLSYAWKRPGAFRDGGLLVMSRVPILGARFERYELPGQPPVSEHPDYYVGKGFLQLRLAGEHGPFNLFDTHLQARYGSDVPHEYHTYRVGQIVQLALALHGTREPATVMGDFNLTDSTSEYEILRGLTGLRDVAVEMGRTQPTVYGAHPLRKTRRDRRIDYVFLRDGDGRAVKPLGVRRAFDDVFEIHGRKASFSDHAGLIAEIEVAESPGTLAPRPDSSALELATATLAQGRAQTRSRRSRDRLAGGLGLAGAALAGASVRNERVTRRRLLRVSLQGAAALALAPGLGFSLLSEVFAPDELRAFRQLTARLDAWRDGGSWVA